MENKHLKSCTLAIYFLAAMACLAQSILAPTPPRNWIVDNLTVRSNLNAAVTNLIATQIAAGTDGSGLTNLNPASVTNAPWLKSWAVRKTFYVDPAYGNDANSGTNQWEPLQTTYQLAQGLKNDCTIRLAAGSYQSSIAALSLSNATVYGYGATVPINKSAGLTALSGNVELDGLTLFDSGNATSIRQPLKNSGTSPLNLVLRDCYIGGLSDCIFIANQSNSVNVTVSSCTFTSKWDTSVCLNYSQNPTLPNLWNVTGSYFAAYGDTNFYNDGVPISSQINTIGAHNFRVSFCPGVYNLAGNTFVCKDGGRLETVGVLVEGSNVVCNLSGNMFDVTSTNGPAWWFVARSNAVINYFGTPPPPEKYQVLSGGVVNFLGNMGSNLPSILVNPAWTGATASFTPNSNPTRYTVHVSGSTGVQSMPLFTNVFPVPYPAPPQVFMSLCATGSFATRIPMLQTVTSSNFVVYQAAGTVPLGDIFFSFDVQP